MHVQSHGHKWWGMDLNSSACAPNQSSTRPSLEVIVFHLIRPTFLNILCIISFYAPKMKLWPTDLPLHVMKNIYIVL